MMILIHLWDGLSKVAAITLVMRSHVESAFVSSLPAFLLIRNGVNFTQQREWYTVDNSSARPGPVIKTTLTEQQNKLLKTKKYNYSTDVKNGLFCLK